MLTVAVLANEFPSPIESYVIDQNEELRRRGVRVVAGSVRRPKADEAIARAGTVPDLVVQCANAQVIVRAAGLCVRRWERIVPLLKRIAFRGKERLWSRVKALGHTFLGACYAVMLDEREVDHIHVHHGYFGSWIAMTAARLLGVPFSMTLYGSDLLLHGMYLDTKLANCEFCFTISEFNREYILTHYPDVDSEKVIVSRVGADIPLVLCSMPSQESIHESLLLLAVGRLHPVKNHAFLVRACLELRAREVPFQCFIVGQGPERKNLDSLIERYGLREHVQLLGYIPEEQRNELYERADVVVLTSRSEGIPVVMMEAMARGKIVLAPAITGIPELVIPDKTGFLYEPESPDDFVAKLLFIHSAKSPLLAKEARSGAPGERCSAADGDFVSPAGASEQLECIRDAARAHVEQNFNRTKNLQLFAELFLQRVAPEAESIPDESLVLQQI